MKLASFTLENWENGLHLDRPAGAELSNVLALTHAHAAALLKVTEVGASVEHATNEFFATKLRCKRLTDALSRQVPFEIEASTDRIAGVIVGIPISPQTDKNNG